MLKRYTFWFTAAILFQLLTAIAHSISLFVSTEPRNDIERQMMELINTYHIDAGGGFHPTYANLVTALSSCFTFLCLFAGLVNGYLLLKHLDEGVLKGVIAINVGIFGTVFVVMAYFTFLPPIVLSGLIFINMLAAYIMVPKQAG